MPQYVTRSAADVESFENQSLQIVGAIVLIEAKVVGVISGNGSSAVEFLQSKLKENELKDLLFTKEMTFMMWRRIKSPFSCSKI
jgi:hypothetical protein